jgi:hypothetical protein
VPNVPGFYIHQTAGNTATNEFGVDAFDVVLDKAPLTNVVLSLSVSNSALAMLDTATLTFTPADWTMPQRVAFRPIDNYVVIADQVVDITVSVIGSLSDDSYDSVAPQVFSALVRDDDFQPALIGDYNADGSVDAADYVVWRKAVGSVVEQYAGADGSGNGVVNENDYAVWQANFGNASPTGTGAGAVVLEEGGGSAVQGRVAGPWMSEGVSDTSAIERKLLERREYVRPSRQDELLLARLLLDNDGEQGEDSPPAQVPEATGRDADELSFEVVDEVFQLVRVWR